MGKQAKITPQEARAAVQKYGGLRPAGRALGIDSGYLHRVCKRPDTDEITEAIVKANRETSKRPSATKTLADFRNTYDKNTIVPAKIRSGLAALGHDGWEYETEFAKASGVGLCDLGKFRDMFSDHIVEIGRSSKRAWAGSKALASKMKDML